METLTSIYFDMKKLFAFSVLLLLSTNIFAQLFTIAGREVGFFYLGPKIGMNLSQISNWSTFAGYENKSRIGLQLGVVGEIGITERLSFDGEFTFISKGQKQTSSFSNDQLNVRYLGIPLLAKYSFKFLGLSKVYAKGGTFTNVRTGGSYTVVYENGVEFSEELSVDGWTRVDWGLSFGCGAEYKMDKGIIGLDLRYDLGIIDVHKSDAERNMNRTMGFTLVYKFDMVDVLSRKKGESLDS